MAEVINEFFGSQSLQIRSVISIPRRIRCGGEQRVLPSQSLQIRSVISIRPDLEQRGVPRRIVAIPSNQVGNFHPKAMAEKAMAEKVAIPSNQVGNFHL